MPEHQGDAAVAQAEHAAGTVAERNGAVGDLARHAHADGFDLHANVAVRAGDRRRLEHLCRYVLRPPLAQDALGLTPAGAVLLRLRRPWRDGTRAIRFAPTELLEKLAAMIPRPRANLLLYHGAFAPRGCVRAARALERRAEPHAPARVPGCAASAPPPRLPVPAVVTGAAPVAPPPAPVDHGPPSAPRAPPAAPYVRPRHVAWADLLRRTFAIDVLACPHCGGRLRLLATIAAPAVIAAILVHLGLPIDPPDPTPARAPAWLPGLGPGCADTGPSSD